MRFQGCPAAVSENEPIRCTGSIRGVGKRWARQSAFWRDRLVRGARRPARASSASQPLSCDLPASWEGLREPSVCSDGVFFLSSAAGVIRPRGRKVDRGAPFCERDRSIFFPQRANYIECKELSWYLNDRPNLD